MDYRYERERSESLPIPSAPPEEDHVMVPSMKSASSILSLSLLSLALSACHASLQMGSEEPKKAEPSPAPAPPPEKAKPAETKPAAEPAKPVVKGDKVEIPGNIVFEFGKATFKEGDEGTTKVLEQLKAFLDANPQVTKLRIEGHTDSVGEAATNEELSGQRALTVKKWLIEKGVAADRLIAVGFGMNKPIADNTTEEGRAQNRRTEFRIAGLHGKNYMGLDPAAGGKVYE